MLVTADFASKRAGGPLHRFPIDDRREAQSAAVPFIGTGLVILGRGGVVAFEPRGVCSQRIVADDREVAEVRGSPDHEAVAPYSDFGKRSVEEAERVGIVVAQ